MDSTFRILEKIIRAANIRQRVIASNIANADTPGYKAKDVRFNDFLKDQMRMMATHPRHIKGYNNTDPEAEIIIEPTASWGDKNNVELNVEIAKMTENQLLHDAAIKILSTKIRMFRNAIMTRGGR
jgi:flagellar basal-body rod protein FlgB